MKTFRITHTADLHLGSHFSSTPEIAASRKMEQLENLRNIIKIAHEDNSEALLICGDLFDTLRVDSQLLAEVQSILGSSDLYVFISPGNHDPATPDSSYMMEGWPDNVHIFRGGLECVELEGKDVCIWGLGFRHSIEAESLLYTFIPQDKKINILMMHGEVVPDENSESRYNPVTPERLASLGVDFCALGHIHKPAHNSIGDFCYCNAGCPSGRGFDEQGDRGVYCGYVSHGFSHVQFVPIPSRRYRSEKVDVSGCVVADEFCARIKEALQKSYGEDYNRHIYDVTMLGTLPKGVMPDSRAIARLLMEEIHYTRITDMTTTELDIDTLMKDGSLRGAFVRTIIGRMEKDPKNRNKYLRALVYGLRAFDGEVRINEDY
ncbi:MAG: DNA repair exonuclease [Ruminococcaceae bacterium]|nr:DNA repair exonuclease [Oscillospiraceae bacterium]